MKLKNFLQFFQKIFSHLGIIAKDDSEVAIGDSLCIF